MIKIAAATAAFGVAHSLLASRPAKRAAARALGERNRDGLYRAFFIGQSAIASGLLTAYIRRQTSRELYCAKGTTALVLHAIQAGAVVYVISGARQVGIRRISGLQSLYEWLGHGPVNSTPEAQGPALDDEGLRRGPGPFAWSRHPLNFSPLPILWLWPRMTTSLFAFNTAATIYLVIGSLHEEARLREAYGDDYEAYVRSGVPFFIPAAGDRLKSTTPMKSLEEMTQ